MSLKEHIENKLIDVEFKHLKQANLKTLEYMVKFETTNSTEYKLFLIDRIIAFTTDQKVCNRNIKALETAYRNSREIKDSNCS